MEKEMGSVGEGERVEGGREGRAAGSPTTTTAAAAVGARAAWAAQAASSPVGAASAGLSSCLGSSASAERSEVHRVLRATNQSQHGLPTQGKNRSLAPKLSLNSCMISVLSLYDSSLRVSSSAMASSKAVLARWHAFSGELRIS